MRLQKILSLMLVIWVLVSSYSVLIHWHLLVCEGCKGITKEKKKGERRYLFKFNFISFGIFARLLWIIRELSFLPNQALKYISRIRWLISPNSGWSCSVVFWCCLLQRVGSLVADTNPIWSSWDLAKQTCYFACCRVDESPFSLKGFAGVRANFSICQRRFLFFFFLAHASPHFLSRVSGFLKFYFYFSFFLSTTCHSLDLHLWLGVRPQNLRFCRAKFLQPSGCYTVKNCVFTFHTTNIFGCFFDIMAQFKLIRSWIRRRCMFNCAAFKSPTKWSNT